MKKLKESNELKAKRIVNLEAQVKEARDTIFKHQCSTTTKEDSANINQPKCTPVDGFQQVKVATLENRTNSIEQNMILLSAKLENLQFNFLAGKRTSDKHTEDNTKPKESQRIYLCEICDYEAVDKACIKKHNESVHKQKLNKQKKHNKSKDTEDLS